MKKCFIWQHTTNIGIKVSEVCQCSAEPSSVDLRKLRLSALYDGLHLVYNLAFHPNPYGMSLLLIVAWFSSLSPSRCCRSQTNIEGTVASWPFMWCHLVFTYVPFLLSVQTTESTHDLFLWAMLCPLHLHFYRIKKKKGNTIFQQSLCEPNLLCYVHCWFPLHRSQEWWFSLWDMFSQSILLPWDNWTGKCFLIYFLLSPFEQGEKSTQ